jgi:hypothetical protein
MRRDFSKLTNAEARQVVENCFRVLFGRYKHSSSTVDLVTVTKEGVSRDRVEVITEFKLNGFINKEDIM